MVYKINKSCISKTNILSFMTPTLFARFLRDTLSISKRGGHKKIKGLVNLKMLKICYEQIS